MKTFLYCWCTEGGMDTLSYFGDGGLAELAKHLEDQLGSKHAEEQWYKDLVLQDKKLLELASTMEVGEAIEHRVGVLIRLKDGRKSYNRLVVLIDSANLNC